MEKNLLEKTRSYLDANLADPEVHWLTTGFCACYSRRSPAKDAETANQDAAAVIPAGKEATVFRNRGAPHPQGLPRRSVEMPKVRRPPRRHCLHNPSTRWDGRFQAAWRG